MAEPRPGITIISLGGNALIRRGDGGTIEEQFENARLACQGIALLAGRGERVVITHGNGPVVGNIVIRNEAAKDIIPPMPLFIADADSEGGIGFMIQQTLYNQLRRDHNIKEVAAIVTQTVVDPSDPAFSDPSKPVGPFYSKEEAAKLSAARGWVMKEDSSGGYRRVVPSPRPKKIIESNIVRKMLDAGIIVIAAGGGGVPVAEDGEGMLRGIDAVVDKDLATALLAKEIGAERFIDLTGVDMVYLDFGKPGQKGLPSLTAKEARRYLEAGEFAPGSMGPKMEAAVEFLEGGGAEVIITAPELVLEALEGRRGTRIIP